MTHPNTRKEVFSQLKDQLPRFRFEQINKALFDRQVRSFEDISTLPKDLRASLSEQLPWMSFPDSQVLSSKRKDTYKAMLTLADGQQIETVLMANRRDSWTICVSSQVGCAMKCGFCATGQMGFKRNLTKDELVDQYRFWNYFLADHPELEQRISNIVFMGMGEPLANYETVRDTINEWLNYTDLGKTRITVSTVGHLARLNHLLEDPHWPHVRLAISLHSADPRTRKEIVPTSHDQFLPTLSTWAKAYLKKFGNNRHYLTFEYVMLRGVNDTAQHAKVLADYVKQIGRIKINLIPYNITDNPYKRSHEGQLQQFKHLLESAGLTVTIRKTMGDDIAAACGQLIKISKKS